MVINAGVLVLILLGLILLGVGLGYAIFGYRCHHEWEIINRYPLTIRDDFGGISNYDVYICRCKKCGKIKKYKV